MYFFTNTNTLMHTYFSESERQYLLEKEGQRGREVEREGQRQAV
jgi:hypothetical protein